MLQQCPYQQTTILDHRHHTFTIEEMLKYLVQVLTRERILTYPVSNTNSVRILVVAKSRSPRTIVSELTHVVLPHSVISGIRI